MKKLIYSKEDLDLILSIEMQEQENEIERLNNIINELEKYIKAEIPEEEFVNSEWYVNILDKLEELKKVGE